MPVPPKMTRIILASRIGRDGAYGARGDDGHAAGDCSHAFLTTIYIVEAFTLL